MSQLIARYNLLVSADKPDNWPAEVSFWWTPDGKVRMHKRGWKMRLDKWFPDMDAAAPSISALHDTGAYLLHVVNRRNPYDCALFDSNVAPKYAPCVLHS